MSFFFSLLNTLKDHLKFRSTLNLKEIPPVDIFLLTHNHYDHQDMMTIRRFPFKNTKVMAPLKLGKYFERNGYSDVNEMDWYEEIIINEKMKITFLPAVHWSKRSLTDTNKTLWGNFLIEYDEKKILFACDTGVGNIYKEIGCLLYTSPSPRDATLSRMPSSA